MQQEAVASFAGKEPFVGAVRALLNAGFDRANLSVLASHQSLEIVGDVPGYPGKPNDALMASLADEAPMLFPLTIAGIAFLSGGPIAAALAALVGAGLGSAALKELLDRIGANRHSADFADALRAGAVLLWVRVDNEAQAIEALSILENAGGRLAHLQAHESD